MFTCAECGADNSKGMAVQSDCSSGTYDCTSRPVFRCAHRPVRCDAMRCDAMRCVAQMVASAKSDLSLPANNVPVIANGYVGTNPVDGAMYMAGVFNGYSSKTPSHRAALPSTVALAVTGPAPVTAGASALDFERATFYRRSTVQNGSVTVHVEQRWFAHRQHRSLLVTDFRAWVDPGTPLPPAGQFGVTLSLSSRAAPSKDVQLHPLPVPAGSPFDAYNGSTMVAETNTSGLTVVAYATTAAASHVSFPSNNSLVTFVTAVRSSLDSATADDVVSDAIADFTAGAAMAANGTLWSSHVQKWATSLWTSGIELTPAAPQYVGLPAAVNMSVFSILSSVREDWPYGLSPGGLTPGYNGHSFWDVETWMYPPIALLYPAVASSLLEYRYARIPGAEEKARSYAGMNYHGAMFPWESAFTGEEVCPSWAATGLREIHISGDIAFAVSQYWKLTNDLVWLRTRGRPLLSGIADVSVFGVLLQIRRPLTVCCLLAAYAVFSFGRPKCNRTQLVVSASTTPSRPMSTKTTP